MACQRISLLTVDICSQLSSVKSAYLHMFAFRGQISGGQESFEIFADLQVQYLV